MQKLVYVTIDDIDAAYSLMDREEKASMDRMRPYYMNIAGVDRLLRDSWEVKSIVPVGDGKADAFVLLEYNQR